jgi:NADH:ubiquinone reductase (H+-translocating)
LSSTAAASACTTALRLQRKLRHQLERIAQGQHREGGARGGVEIVVLDPEPYMTYQPFLPEAAAGSISPRHVVVPLRRVLTGCRLVIGEAVSIDHGPRIAHVNAPAAADEGTGPRRNPLHRTGVGPGSLSRTLPVPGLSEHGNGFKTSRKPSGCGTTRPEQLDIASTTRNPEVCAAAFTFVFLGGGYAGVEALAELEDMARTSAATITTYGRRK